MQLSIQMRFTWLNFLLSFNVLLFLISIVVGNFVSVGGVNGFGLMLGLLGGLSRDLVVEGGEWWRLVAATFLHADIMHLLLNMFALWNIGRIVESFYGDRQVLSFYITSGVGASLVSLVFSGVPSVGASGAVFGLLGVLLAGALKKRGRSADLPFRVVDILPIVIYSLAVGFVPGSNIDNFAHIGGLVTGFGIGYLLEHKLTVAVPRWKLQTERALHYSTIALFVTSYVWMSYDLVRTLFLA